MTETMNSKEKNETYDLKMSPYRVTTTDKEKLEIENTETKTFAFSAKAYFCLTQFKQLKIELVMFLYMFSFIVWGVSSMNMILDKVCLTHLHHPPILCRNLSMDKAVKTQVEQIANNYHLGHTLVLFLPSVVLSCFIGPWSDKYGRKQPMTVAFIAIIINDLGNLLCAHFMDSRVEWYFIPALFTSMTGGSIVMLTVVFSYATDISTTGGRTLKYVFMEVAMGLSMPIGSLVGGYVFDSFGYTPVILTSTAGHVLGLLVTMFLLEETIGVGNTDSWRTKLRNLFSTEAFMDSFRVTMKKRPNKGRKQIFMLLGTMSIAFLTAASTNSLMYLYVMHVYEWDNKHFSTVSAIFSVLGMVATMIAVPVLKRFKAGDPTLGIIGTVSLILKSVGVGIATKSGVFYLANLVGLLSSLSGLAARTRISKVVSKNDLGKVFSFVTTAEMVGPFVGTIVFTQVFNETLGVFPGMAFLICGSLLIFSMAVYIWLAFQPTVNYEELQNDQETVDQLPEADKANEKTKY